MKLTVPSTINRENKSGWCPGCGHGIIMRMLAEAVDELGIQEDIILVTDVACGQLAVSVVEWNDIGAAHGRPIITAAGAKRARPDQIVVANPGDGSAYSIGIESTIHCALRNENILALVTNNCVFGMTGGQMSPESLPGQVTTSSPHGRDPKVNGNPFDVVKTLDLNMICPSHGVIWRSHIADILDKYEAWTTYQTTDKAVVVYDSMWHSTESMAREITDAFIKEGIPAELIDVKHMHISDIMLELCDAKYVAVGSPTLNSNMMPTVAAFLTYMRGLSPNNAQRIGLAFGSYGWAPLGPKQVYAELENAKFQLPVPVVAQQWIPSAENLAELQETVCKMIEAAQA